MFRLAVRRRNAILDKEDWTFNGKINKEVYYGKIHLYTNVSVRACMQARIRAGGACAQLLANTEIKHAQLGKITRRVYAGHA